MLRAPSSSLPCTPPALVRRFTLLKLLLALFLIATIIVLRPEPVRAPTMQVPAPEMVAGPLQLTGTGSPASRVEVVHGALPLTNVTVTDDGTWSATIALAAGTYELQAEAIVGDERRFSPDGRQTVTLYDLPTLALQAGAAEGGEVEILLSGAGSPGARVRPIWNNRRLDPVTVDEQGQWRAAVSAAAPSENHFELDLLDRKDNVLGQAPSRDLSLAALPPQVTPFTVDERRVDQLETSDNGLVAGVLVVNGQGLPGARVLVRRDGAPIAAPATVDASGRWELAAAQVLAPGGFEYTGQMVAADDTLLGEATFAVVIPSPPRFTVSGGATDVETATVTGSASPETQVQLAVDGDVVATLDSDSHGTWVYQTLLDAGHRELQARDAAGLTSSTIAVDVALAVPVIEGQNRSDDGALLPGLYGRGRPSTQLVLITAGTVIGQASVAADGTWRCDCTLAPGEILLQAREVNDPARISEPYRLTVPNPVLPWVPGPGDPDAPPFRCPEPSAPGTIVDTIYIVGCGETASHVAARLGVTVAELMTFNPQVSDPRLIYFGQKLNIPTNAACFDTPAAPTS